MGPGRSPGGAQGQSPLLPAQSTTWRRQQRKRPQALSDRALPIRPTGGQADFEPTGENEMKKAPVKSKANAKRTAKPKAKAAPHGMNTLSPHLVCAGAADAIAFYKKAFGAEEMIRVPGKDGRLMHAALLICGSSVMLVDEMPEWGVQSPKSLKGSPVTIHLFVEDVDAFVQRAVKAGATVKVPVADMFWGDRYGVIEDPFGHKWSIATHLRDLSEQELRDAARREMGG